MEEITERVQDVESNVEILLKGWNSHLLQIKFQFMIQHISGWERNSLPVISLLFWFDRKNGNMKRMKRNEKKILEFIFEDVGKLKGVFWVKYDYVVPVQYFLLLIEKVNLQLLSNF